MKIKIYYKITLFLINDSITKKMQICTIVQFFIFFLKEGYDILNFYLKHRSYTLLFKENT